MGRYAAHLLGFDPLQVEKRLLVIVETSGFSYYAPATAQSHLLVDVQPADQVSESLRAAPGRGTNGNQTRLKQVDGINLAE